MTRLAFNRLMLSLLLLLSQQMALTHAMSHVSAALGSAAHTVATPGATKGATVVQSSDDDGDLSSAIAQDKSCHQCLAFAQLFGPLANTPRAFATPDLRDTVPVIALSDATVLRTVCAFQSRAPPQA